MVPSGERQREEGVFPLHLQTQNYALFGTDSSPLLSSSHFSSVGKQVVDVPSFLVRVDSQKHIDFALTSPFGGGRPGRVKRKNLQ